MIKSLTTRVARPTAILGFILAALLLSPPAAPAQSAHEGKFNVPAGGRIRIFTNVASVTKTVLVTVCVNTSGAQSATVDVRDDAGSVVSQLANVKLGQCRSATAELATDENIAVGSAVAIAGAYTVSALP
ncbi:MAG: hypothetical protein ACREQP_16705 [Candidatus Binatia bacterium]